jgi:Kdo2-lipid IVA lauroyltransferase/acyltransferase
LNQHILSVKGAEYVQQLHADGKGMIFVTPHLGCFEILVRWFSQIAPVTILYKPAKINIINNWIMQGRKQSNVTLAPANRQGIKQMLQALQKTNAIGLLPDQVPDKGDGAWAPFFGKPAYTNTLALKLHLKTGAPLVLATAIRQQAKQGLPAGFHLVFEPWPATLAFGQDTEDQATQLNLAMEYLIQKAPTQYLWTYNRYKQPLRKA